MPMCRGPEYVHTVCMEVLLGARKEHLSPGDGVTGGCEALDTSVGN